MADSPSRKIPPNRYGPPFRYLARVLLCTAVAGLWANGAEAARSCDDWHAEFVSVEGDVEVQRQSAGAWIAVDRGDRLCTEDTVRVQRNGRALVDLPDGSTLRLDGNTSFRLPEPEGGTGTLVDLIRGAIHVISRDPRSLSFRTPFMNAGLEGTEFDLRVAEERTTVAVLEGQVLATGTNGTIHVPSGQVASADATQKPESRPAQPIELMRWTSYYASVIDGPLPPPDGEPTGATAHDPAFFTGRAAARLRTGRLSAAEADLASAERLAPRSADALALRTVIAVARGAIPEAMRLAEDSVAIDPAGAAPLIAQSYAEQAAGDTIGALTAAQLAARLHATNAIAWSRLAELRLATGDFEGALDAAGRAKAIRPRLGYPDTVIGFTRLGQFDTSAATDAFRRAAELDQGSPLPHLGLGLTLALEGNVTDARREIERAVALDPASATMRSYMAKVYDTEHRDKLTSSQLRLAKDFDPSDPTPWLYDVFHELNANRPVVGLRSLNAAIARNHDAPVFRSSFRMDEDQATRSAGLGRLFRELGFEQLALNRGWQAVASDPRDYAGHRLLADVYSTAPRHEIVRVNELLQSQLLQPVNLRPIRADLALPNLFIRGAGGLDQRSFSEFSPLLTQNGIRFQASSVVAPNDTIGEDLVLSGLHDRLSYSVGQFRFKTDGFRPNNDLDQRVANAFLQYAPSQTTSLQAELRTTRTEKGDLAMSFDPTQYSASSRINEADDSLRLGLRRNLSATSTLLASVIFRDTDYGLSAGPTYEFTGHRHGYSVDVQHLRASGRWRLYDGVMLAHESEHKTTYIAPSTDVSDFVLEQSALYAYGLVDIAPSATLTLGGSFNSVDTEAGTHAALNPKLGITWRPTSRTAVRASAFTTLEGSLSTSKQDLQPRLEPGQVAGFSQFLLGANGDEAKVHGLGVDHTITDNVFVGLEGSERSFDRDLYYSDGTVRPLNFDEQLRRAYLYWTPLDRVAFSAEYQREDVDIDHGRGQSFFRVTQLHTRRLPLELHYFAPSGVTAGFKASRVSQTGWFDLGTARPDQPADTAPGSDRFWVLDASLGYRLGKRRGMLSLNVANLTDRKFQFQDTDPENPTFMPERMVYLRITIAFE